MSNSLRKLVVTEIDTKEDLEAQQEGYDYVVDEKAKSATLTARGVVKAEKFLNWIIMRMRPILICSII